MLAFLGMPGGAEWLIVLVVALLLFGSRLPEVMRSIARSIAGFKHEMEGAKRELAEEGTKPEEPLASPDEPDKKEGEEKPSSPA